jgi:hypothetical protein
VIGEDVEIEACWRAVVVIKCVAKNLGAFSNRLPTWPPYPLHFFVCKPPFFILIIKSCKEESIEAHLCEETSVCVRMSEGVNLPADSGSDTELLHYEFMTYLHVVDHVVVVGASLIMHGPACIQKLETALSNEASDLLL